MAACHRAALKEGKRCVIRFHYRTINAEVQATVLEYQYDRGVQAAPMMRDAGMQILPRDVPATAEEHRQRPEGLARRTLQPRMGQTMADFGPNNPPGPPTAPPPAAPAPPAMPPPAAITAAEHGVVFKSQYGECWHRSEHCRQLYHRGVPREGIQGLYACSTCVPQAPSTREQRRTALRVEAQHQALRRAAANAGHP